MRTRYNHKYRYKGGQLGEGIKLVTRGTWWGNPYRVEDHGRAEAVRMFRRDLERMDPEQLRQWLAPLADARGIYCPCPTGAECHGDVILEHLNKLHP